MIYIYIFGLVALVLLIFALGFSAGHARVKPPTMGKPVGFEELYENKYEIKGNTQFIEPVSYKEKFDKAKSLKDIL